MLSIAPTRSLNRRSRDLLLLAALVFLLGAALAVGGIALHVFSLVVPFNAGYGIYDMTRKLMLLLGSLVSMVALALALRAATWKTDNRNARLLGELLAAQLDHRYVLVRNISKRTTGYIDAALISRHGLLALRISNRKGEFFNEGGHWLRRGKGGWKPMRWNPTREVVARAAKLRAHLKMHGMPDMPVFAAVVFLRDAPELRLTLKAGAIPALHASQLVDGLRDGYFAQERISAQAAQALVNVLYE